MKTKLLIMALAISTACAQQPETPEATEPAKGEQAKLGFFITSAGPGDGANLGGLAGADAHCQKLAEAAGAGDRSWRAYLSASPSGDQPAVNARNRIGAGPWHNAKGVQVARDVDDLHSENNNLSK
ncbi:MAG: lectin, partial [Acidobacteriota bacterium]|nr:lectin [Acidobacteriota bacterium]